MQLKQLSFALVTIASVYCADPHQVDPAWYRFTENYPLRTHCLKNLDDSVCKDIEAFFNLARTAGAEQKNIDPAKNASAAENIANFPENRFALIVLQQMGPLGNAIDALELTQDLSELPMVAMELFAQNAVTGTSAQNKLISKLVHKFVMEILPQQAALELMRMAHANA